MPAPNEITAEKLLRLIGMPTRPAIVDIRDDDSFAADPRRIPGSLRRPTAAIDRWRGAIAGPVVFVGEDGHADAHGVAALLRADGTIAEVLAGGAAGWSAARLPMVPDAAVPRDVQDRTRWVTRSRPKVDRIACPWLIRRFVDPHAEFFYVPPSTVADVATRMEAEPFDIEGDGLRWTHVGSECTFDAMIAAFGLGAIDPLARLATIVRGADTARPDLAPEAAGLLAISLGLSRQFSDDHAQLEAGMLVYDALYRWCRDATGETHDWTSHGRKQSA